MIAISDTVWTLITTSPLSFGIGVLTGFLASNRYRLSRRNGEDHEE